MPELRLSANINHLIFDEVETLERFRQQSNIGKELGQDISISLIWRPFMSQNIVARLSGAALIPGDGFDDLFGEESDTPYSVLFNLTLTY